MGRLTTRILLLVLVALLGAAGQSYVRMNSGPTFVDKAVRKIAGSDASMEDLGRSADKYLEKAKDAVKDMDK